jgi:hypothetical protein
MTLFSKAWKWLDNLFFGRQRMFEERVDLFIMQLTAISSKLGAISDSQAKIVRLMTENLGAAQQTLVRALGAFERSDVTFEKIGFLADKMAAREAALEEALIAKAKAVMVETKIAETKAKAEEAELPSEYDKRY